MASLWDDVRAWLSDATKSAAKEAEDLSRRGRLKFDMMNLNRQLEQAFADLGGLAYELLTKKKLSDLTKEKEVLAHLAKIKSLEQELKRKKRAYERGAKPEMAKKPARPRKRKAVSQ
jgi:hypothetical protein